MPARPDIEQLKQQLVLAIEQAPVKARSLALLANFLRNHQKDPRELESLLARSLSLFETEPPTLNFGEINKLGSVYALLKEYQQAVTTSPPSRGMRR